MSDILIVDDERDIRELVSDILEDEGYATRLAGSSQECLDALAAHEPSLLILDIWLKDSAMDGIDILKLAKRDYPSVPVVIISGHGNIEIAVAAIKQGAYDFIEKPFNIDQLLVVVRRAMEAANLRRENTALRKRDVAPVEMIGEDPAFRSFQSQLEKVAKTNGRVLLSGGGGSGKETAARYVHMKSDRADLPFVMVNCMGEEEEILSSLFGEEDEGVVKHVGLIEQAMGGVLFFDEVGELPLEVQSKLLKVLVEQKYRRVGGNDKIAADFRVISSTSHKLEDKIAAGTFREDLFHRVNVVPISVPSLAERREDIPLLAEYFVETYCRGQNVPIRGLSEEAKSVLSANEFSGNIRQLRNMVERAVVLSDGSSDLKPEDFPTDPGEQSGGRLALTGALAGLPLREAREEFEREYLAIQINRFNGNISKTASFVGMERSALHRKLKSLGLVTANKKADEATDED